MARFSRWSSVALMALAAGSLACGAGRPPEMPADLILINGAVVTLDPTRPEARAVAVRGETIAAVGSDDEIARLAGPSTRRIDLRGAMVVPGLVDAHGHVRSLGEELANLDLHGVASVEEVARMVRERDKTLPEGAWITGHGWDQNLWPGKAFPDHRPLTAAAPGRPVWLSRVDGHASWANLKAMQAAGITRKSADPAGGRIERDARGDPTGVFVDNAQDLVEKARPQATRAQIKEWLGLSLQRLAEGGLTEIHDAAVSPEDVDAYRELADEGRLPLRVYLMWNGIGKSVPDPLLERPTFVNYKNRVTLRAVKLMVDGAMGSRGAVFLADYSDDKGNHGLFVTPPEELERRATLAMRKGYQVCTHAIGDRGIRVTIDAYEKALAAVKPPDPRPRIEHLQCVARQDVARLKPLGIIASMQPSHATSDMYWAEDRIGKERGEGLYAWRWVLDSGVVIAAGSDFPVDPEKPLIGLHSAVTRQDLKNWPAGGWHPDQKMTLEEALRAYTAGAAYAAYEEDHKGKIAPDYWADLTVIGKDLRAIPPEEIANAGIDFTIVGGAVVYEKR
ncbi:MAG TPA: amidohydrolase [Candidatus Polarisedimenticolia bacterium]|nr:amidohydrolase [Candidatus Polarisedimenticolia bacterium]